MIVDDLARIVCERLAEQALQRLATVRESPGVIDIAFLSPRGASWMIRCASEPDQNDHLAVATILAQGPLVRVALIYGKEAERTEEIASRLIGVETCTIESLPTLLAHWKRQEQDR